MSLPVCQQRALNAMENVLQASEPRLAAMFAMFTGLAEGEEPVRAEHLSRRRLIRLRRPGPCFIVFPVLTGIALIVTLIVGLVTSFAPGCATAAAVSSVRKTTVSCVTRGQHSAGTPSLPLGGASR